MIRQLWRRLRAKRSNIIATITTIEGRRHVSGTGPKYAAERAALVSPGARVGKTRQSPTSGLWDKRNTPSGAFEAVKRSGDVTKGVRREN